MGGRPGLFFGSLVSQSVMDLELKSRVDVPFKNESPTCCDFCLECTCFCLYIMLWVLLLALVLFFVWCHDVV